MENTTDAASPLDIPVSRYARMLEWACRVHTNHAVHRYLMCNSAGRLDGAEKALRHAELCRFYLAVVYGTHDPDRAGGEYPDEYERVHDATQALTDYMDEAIGFPIEGRPDYDKLAPAFFERFHALAMQALTANAEVKGGRDERN